MIKSKVKVWNLTGINLSKEKPDRKVSLVFLSVLRTFFSFATIKSPAEKIRIYFFAMKFIPDPTLLSELKSINIITKVNGNVIK